MMVSCCRQLLLLMLIMLLPFGAAAEPMRVLVPKFFGPEPLSQHVRTTVFLEMIKAFRATDRPDRGAWILYGRRPLPEASHAAVVDVAGWPSTRADLAIWGEVQQYAEGAILQLYLSLTPLLNERQVRPELWQVKLQGRNGTVKIDKTLPGVFYEFEPLILNREAIRKFTQPEGIAIYSSRQGGRQIGHLQEVMRFYEIYDDAMLIVSGGLKGWVRTGRFSSNQSEAVNFSKGIVRLLRGDLAGARRSFQTILEMSGVPQHLRVHCLLYIGLTRELANQPGGEYFARAYRLNRLDKTAASFYLMGQLADLARLQLQGAGAQMRSEVTRFQKELNKLQVLYAKNDAWFNHLKELANQLVVPE